jgi:hypothetical protein
VFQPTNLQAVRTSWLEAYKTYQYVCYLQFGKSEINLKQSANTYPTNAAGIEVMLVQVDNLALLSQFDKQGFLLWII